MKKLTALISLLILIKSSSLFSQNDTVRVYPNGSYFVSYLVDTKDAVIAPIKWKPLEWAAFGAVAGLTFLSYQYDAEIQKYFQSRQTDLGKNISQHGFEPFGSGVYSMPLMGIFYAQGAIWKNQRSKKVALMGVKAYLVAGLLVNIPKITIGRHRPYQDTPSDPNQFEGPITFSYKSFPSGHTTAAFAVATVIASEYQSTIWVPILSYTVAAMSGMSRIYDNKHWASDVVFGAALGWSIGKLVHRSTAWKIKTVPIVGSEQMGLSLNYQF